MLNHFCELITEVKLILFLIYLHTSKEKVLYSWCSVSEILRDQKKYNGKIMAR